MTDEQIYRLSAKAANCSDPDSFASGAALSLLDQDEPGQEVDLALAGQLYTLWEVYHLPFQDLLDRMGLNQSQCSRRFCISLRTVQDWAGNRRNPPPYVRQMMAEAVGLLSIR